MDALEIDWNVLERLRSRFLKADTGAGVYWKDENDLAAYHAFFAARIGWKWDSALENAEQVGFQLKSKRLLDWGCGSGIATLRVLAHFGEANIESVLLWDHSLLACKFAQKTIQAAYPDLKVEIATSPESDSLPDDTLVLVSHTLNELTLEAQDALSGLLRSAAQILIVEPGDYSSSRLLIRQREALRERFDIAAPCTHCLQCPMLEPENGRHWCHLFGKPPVEAFTDGNWARFAAMMEIDLRSLPYSFLALNHKRLAPNALAPGETSRIIGRPRQFKGYTRILSCDHEGLRDLEIQKRDEKSLWKSLKKGKDGSLYQWGEIESGRLKKGGPALIENNSVT